MQSATNALLQPPSRYAASLCRAAPLINAAPFSDIAALFRRCPQGYTEIMKLTRITVDPGVCTGKPCIRGLRFPVARLLGLLAVGSTRDQILADYPYLEPEDIDEALQYAALLAKDETIELAR